MPFKRLTSEQFCVSLEVLRALNEFPHASRELHNHEANISRFSLLLFRIVCLLREKRNKGIEVVKSVEKFQQHILPNFLNVTRLRLVNSCR
jgi:hypothetical protein